MYVIIQAFKKNSFIVKGWLALLAAVFLVTSLLTYHTTDPSLNRVSDNQVENFFGYAGAYVSDPLLQLFGLACFLLPLGFLVWSCRVFFQRRFSHFGARLVALLGAVLLLAALLSYFPAPEIWPFYIGMGGFFGDFIAGKSKPLLGGYGFFTLAGVVFLLVCAFAMSVRRSELSFFKKVILLFSRVVCKAAKLLDNVKFTQTVKPTKEKGAAVRSRGVASVSGDSEEDYNAEQEIPLSKKNVSVEIPKLIKKRPQPVQKSLKLDPNQFELPDLDLLVKDDGSGKVKYDSVSLQQNAKILMKVLEDFGVKGEILRVRPGPVVTLYELEPSPGTKSSRVVGLSDDIARSMSSVSARIAVIPGRNAIGIELPNSKRETVYLRELLETESYRDERIKLPIALGKDIGGEVVIADLARMPHLLVAGTTGSGKSVAVNAMILSYLYRLSPEECKFIMIDPKMLELSVYDGIPNLLSPVVTEPGKAVVALKWAVREMENRYRAMSNLGVRNVAGYNKRIDEALKNGEILERTVQTGFDQETGEPIYETQPLEMDKLPFIVIIVDEMADLMLTAGKDIEASIQRLAQMARAAGIHMIMATQRPSVDVITGVIKANFPTRISFQVTSRIDSRTIIGEQGAEQLLGMGDMLYMAGGGRTMRVHGPFVDDKEVEKVVNHLKSQGKPTYVEDVTKEEEGGGDSAGAAGAGGSGNELYDKAVSIVIRDKKASTSYIQRQLRIGYNRAADLIDRMEREGVVSAANHAGKREVLAGNS